MKATRLGARAGSRPKPPKAGARSASLEPGRAPSYLSTSQLLSRKRERKYSYLLASTIRAMADFGMA